MLPSYIRKDIAETDTNFGRGRAKDFILPTYNPKSHYLELTRSKYFRALVALRHHIKMSTDYYFGVTRGAKNIDLFMITLSISSPTGPGSDSEPLPIAFGKYNSNLVDSSQFGFEPLLLNGIDEVYCYLPSMRGENPDKRHLNQFFHCEAEVVGDFEKLIPIIEGYIKALSEVVLAMPNVLKKIGVDYKKSNTMLKLVIDTKQFPRITLDEAVDTLVECGYEKHVTFTSHGRDISSKGSVVLASLCGFKTPFWITSFDRDRVPFYQKPDPNDLDKVINADLVFPPVVEGGFGGEIVGCGQRQDDPQEMLDSLKRQKVSKGPYEWYIDLRRQPSYKTTSGFGLGIERFLAWSLGRDDIKDVILYPRLKNVRTLP